MGSAFLRIYGELNDFLRPAWRQEALAYPLHGPASVKDIVEAVGVPHTEIDLILVNGTPVTFSHGVSEGDRVAVFPRFRLIDLGGVVRVGPLPQPQPRFVADVHLGRLAGYLRFAGFDTAYRNDYEDREIVAISARENRTLLTRDLGLLKHNAVERGYFVRHTQPGRQLVEVLLQFDLVPHAAPFSRCVRCNVPLERVAKQQVADRLPPRTREHYREFSSCSACARIYWQGSHYARMQEFLDMTFAAATKRRLPAELKHQPDLGA